MVQRWQGTTCVYTCIKYYNVAGITLHLSYSEWPKVQTLLSHYYTWCAELETENS